MSPAIAHETPVIFGKYELLECLGGGMADVYRARDRVTGKTVAIKILKREYSADEDMNARFLDEARTAAPLEHRNIINVFDFGEVAGSPYMVMEFLRGQDLRGAIRNGCVGSIADKLGVMLQIAEAIEYIHSNGVVHRDIKPDNIHIDTSGTARLIDFGIAKSRLSSMKTQVGFAVGTLAYMAPEQLLGTSTKLELMDVYAFGLVLYEVLTGVRPVSGDTEQQICYRILNEPLVIEPLKQAGVPQPVIDLIWRCTAKQPGKRIQSFQEIQQEMRRIIADMCEAPTVVQTIVAPPETPARNSGLSLWAWALLAVAATGLLFLALILTRSKTAPTVAGASVTAAPALEPKPGASHPSLLQHPSGDMVLVPAGPFLFGKNKEPRTLPDFYIDKTEVTNQAYAQYAKATKARKPRGKPEYPVVNITAADARAFCAWAGKRLPTMYEWEKAARGTDGRDFPWGNQIEPWRANVQDNRERPTTAGLMPVVSFPEGQSIYGALNMAGNVWEYVSDTRPLTSEEIQGLKTAGLKYRGNPATRWPIMYGGSFLGDLSSNNSSAKAWDEAVAYPNDKGPNIGCRCAK